ncbi:MAG: DUF86 domain-containing protein [Nanoarchaeota archaeon]
MNKETEAFARHIIDSIDSIKSFLGSMSKEELQKDRLRQSAIIRELEVIGEAVKNLPESVKKEFKSIPWKQIAGMRDKLIHHYFGVDLNVVWQVIEFDLDVLKEETKKILNKSR